jgi:hypothetical protein
VGSCGRGGEGAREDGRAGGLVAEGFASSGAVQAIKSPCARHLNTTQGGDYHLKQDTGSVSRRYSTAFHSSGSKGNLVKEENDGNKTRLVALLTGWFALRMSHHISITYSPWTGNCPPPPKYRAVTTVTRGWHGVFQAQIRPQISESAFCPRV